MLTGQRTQNSFRTAIGATGTVVDILANEHGYSSIALADRTAFGFVPFVKECTKRKVKPVFGLEIGVTEKTARASAIMSPSTHATISSRCMKFSRLPR
jgi:DNA polymerase III alpha subunit